MARTMPTKRKPTKDVERPADLLFWFGNGFCGGYKARVSADTEISIGRTNSKRALGFLVLKKDEQIADFALNKDQVAELAAYLQRCALGGLRKPLGRKPTQMSLAARNSPKHRLHMVLESAATDAHPGWHDIGDHCYEVEAGTPSGKRLVAWFKKTHPRKAARIEREFTKGLWKGV